MLSFLEIRRTLLSRKVKKNSVTEKSLKANASVGQAPTHAAPSTPSPLAKTGSCSSMYINPFVASIHLVHSENLLVALTHRAVSKWILIV